MNVIDVITVILTALVVLLTLGTVAYAIFHPRAERRRAAERHAALEKTIQLSDEIVALLLKQPSAIPVPIPSRPGPHPEIRGVVQGSAIKDILYVMVAASPANQPTLTVYYHSRAALAHFEQLRGQLTSECNAALTVTKFDWVPMPISSVSSA